MPAPIAPVHSSAVVSNDVAVCSRSTYTASNPARGRDHRDVGGARLRERQAEHELAGVDPVTQRGRHFGHAVHHCPSVLAGTLIPRRAYLKISASRSVASRPTRVTVSTSGDSARSAATVHCSFGRVAKGSKW